jgi:hypothetical protein
MKVFWSWQSDTPGRIGRHLVRRALDKAIEELKETPEVEESKREQIPPDLHLDHDREGVPGSPDLARLILDKIARSTVFVADVTPVGAVTVAQIEEEPKKLINSNVAIELGYALRALSDESLLMVMNDHYGNRGDLPFDLQAKAGPIIFTLSPEAQKAEIEKVENLLKAKLKTALREYVAIAADAVRKNTPFPSIDANENDPARFRKNGEPIGKEWDFLHGTTGAPVFFIDGPAMWLRLLPANGPGGDFSIHYLADTAYYKSNFALKLFTFGNSQGMGVRAHDGFGYFLKLNDGTPLTVSVVFVFKTGEIWSVDSRYLDPTQKKLHHIETVFTQRIRDYANFLIALGMQPPYRWICGITGIEGFSFAGAVPPGQVSIFDPAECLSNEVIETGTYDNNQSAESALRPFFKKIYENCGLERPKSLEER